MADGGTTSWWRTTESLRVALPKFHCFTLVSRFFGESWGWCFGCCWFVFCFCFVPERLGEGRFLGAVSLSSMT